MKAKIIGGIIVMLFIGAFIYANYQPEPAPVPMKTFNVYAGTLVHGYFNIEDPSGPEGLEIEIEPDGLVITSSAITPIAGYDDARRYTYYFDYQAGEYSRTFIINAKDSKNRVVSNSIEFNVIIDELHVFTECGEVTEPNEPVSGIWWNNAQQNMRDTSRGNLVFHYNRVVEGKESLSPKYANLDVLEEMIAKYDNPSYVVMQGHLVEN